MKHLLRVDGLHVRRSQSFYLHIDHLKLAPKMILCIAGPNGSGKTTFIECLSGLLFAPVGEITICGHPLKQQLRSTKSLLGFIPDDEGWLIKELCAKEYFELLVQVYSEAGMPRRPMIVRIEELARSLHFTDRMIPLGQLSHGNKKKVQIIAGLLHSPKVIIIDELRNGLDPIAIIAAEEIVREEAARGACIIAATHDLWWAERFSDQTALLMEGKIISHQSTQTIVTRYGSLEAYFIKTVTKKAVARAAV